MKKQHKLLSIALASAMALSSVSTARATSYHSPFTDLSPNSWCYGYVMNMVGHGMLSGYPDNTFRQNDYITRAETATALSKLELPQILVSKNYTDVQNFSWYYSPIHDAYRSGVMLGINHDTTSSSFYPNRYLTRADAAIIASRLYGLQRNWKNTHLTQFWDYNDIQANARIHIQNLVNAGILSGYPDNTFKPNQPVTRAEFSRIFNFITYTSSIDLANNLKDSLDYENILYDDTTLEKAYIQIDIPDKLHYGENSSTTVHLKTENIPDGTLISLSLSNNSSGITIPSSVRIYNNTASFEMYTSRYTERQTYTLIATYEGKQFSKTFYLNKNDNMSKDVYIKKIDVESSLYYGRNDTIEIVVTTKDVPDGEYVCGSISDNGLYLKDNKVKVLNNKAVFELNSKTSTPTGVYQFKAEYDGHYRTADVVVSETPSDKSFIVNTIVERELHKNENDSINITVYTNNVPNGQYMTAKITSKLVNSNTIYSGETGLNVTTPILVYNNKAVFTVYSSPYTPEGGYDLIIDYEGNTHKIRFYVGKNNIEEPEEKGNIQYIDVDDYLREGCNDSTLVTVKTRDIPDGTDLYPEVEYGLTVPYHCTVYDDKAEFYVRNHPSTATGRYDLWINYNGETYETTVRVK